MLRAPSRACRAFVLLLGVAVPLAGACGAAAKEAEVWRGAPFCGLMPASVGAPEDRAPAMLEHLAGLGHAYLATTPVRWDAIEPHPPRAGPPRYDWKALDEAVVLWQLAGLEPVLVLSPACRWASQAAAGSAWVRELRERLGAEEVKAALHGARGAAPPRLDHWKAWERFVRDVVERYDGDGADDAPGLRGAVRHVQILASVDPACWLGSAEEYMRLLHHAGVGALSAHAQTCVLPAAFALRGTGHAPHPDLAEWDFRIARLDAPEATLARIETARQFSILRRVLDAPRLFQALALRSAGPLEDDVQDLRFLKQRLVERGAADKRLWLLEAPTRRMASSSASGGLEPAAPEARLRAHWLAAAMNPAHSEHGLALPWLRQGQAFDAVRGLTRALAAGADVVLLLAPRDEPPDAHPRAEALRGQGFVLRDPQAPAPAQPQATPSWWALRQAMAHLGGHASAQETTIAAPGVSVVFRFDERSAHPWRAVLLLDARVSWAGTPGAPLPVRDVLVGLPSGRYVLEWCRTGPEEPRRQEVEVSDGMLTVQLGPAPIYILPR